MKELLTTIDLDIYINITSSVKEGNLNEVDRLLNHVEITPHPTTEYNKIYYWDIAVFPFEKNTEVLYRILTDKNISKEAQADVLFGSSYDDWLSKFAIELNDKKAAELLKIELDIIIDYKWRTSWRKRWKQQYFEKHKKPDIYGDIMMRITVSLIVHALVPFAIRNNDKCLLDSILRHHNVKYICSCTQGQYKEWIPKEFFQICSSIKHSKEFMNMFRYSITY